MPFKGLVAIPQERLDAGLDIAALHQVEGADLLGQVATFEQTAVVGLFDIGRQFSEERLAVAAVGEAAAFAIYGDQARLLGQLPQLLVCFERILFQRLGQRFHRKALTQHRAHGQKDTVLLSEIFRRRAIRSWLLLPDTGASL